MEVNNLGYNQGGFFMSDLLAARAQMGTSLAFHIIFASLGVGLPLLLCIAEGLALWHKDSGWMTLTRRWTKAFALLFAIGLPFAPAGFALFIEASVLGLSPSWWAPI